MWFNTSLINESIIELKFSLLPHNCLIYISHNGPKPFSGLRIDIREQQV